MIVDFDETKLLKLIGQDDREAFAILYKHYLHDLYRYVFLISKSKEISEEIVQDIFVKIWERRKKLYTITYFKSYIFRSAKNLLLDQLKREKTAAKVIAMVQPAEESYEKADHNIIYKEYQQIANEAYALLPTKRKQIVELRTIHDLSLDEIAAKLNISKGVVKKQLYSGLDSIKKYISNHGNIIFLLIFIKSLFN